MATKHRVIKLGDLKYSFFVRRGLNQDHVLMLAELYEAALTEAKGDSVAASRAVQAIQVTDDGVLVDGRHRKEAMELAQLTEARVEVLPPMTTSELVVMATKANYGGALPPSREDIIFTVEQLLTKHGMTQAQVESSLSMLPKTVVRKYINMANKRINELRLKLAITDITNGIPIATAARNHGLKVEAVQLQLEGKKPKSKAGAAIISANLTSLAKGFSSASSRAINRALDEYRDGELPEEAVQGAINHFGHLLRRMFLRAEDWNNRLKAAKLGESLPKGDGDTDNIFDPTSKVERSRGA